jgi:hypothetical protein
MAAGSTFPFNHVCATINRSPRIHWSEALISRWDEWAGVAFATRALALKLKVQRHRIMSATLALQPSLGTYYQWAEFVTKPAVSATEEWLVHRHQSRWI